MADIIEKKFEVRWDDVDFNGHLRNTRYIEFANYARLVYFQEAGWPASRMREVGYGALTLSDEIQYRNEVFLSQYVTVRAHVTGMSADGSRWRVSHAFLRPDGKQAASLRTLGAWFDVTTRRISSPPDVLLKVMDDLRSDDTEVLA